MTDEALIAKLEAERDTYEHTSTPAYDAYNEAISIIRQHLAEQPQDAVKKVANALLLVRGNSGQYGGSNPPTIEEEAKAAIAAMRQPASEVDIAIGAKAVRGVFDLSLVGPDVGFKAEDVAAAIAKAWGLRTKSAA